MHDDIYDRGGFTVNPAMCLVLVVAAALVAFPLAGDAHAQSTGSLQDIVDTAKTASPNTIKLTFTKDIEGVEAADFRVSGAVVSGISSGTGTVSTSQTLTITLSSNSLDPDSTPRVSIASGQSFTSGTGDSKVTYSAGNVVVADGIPPQVILSDTKITGPNQVTITYNEGVVATLEDYAALRMGDSPNRDPRNISSVTGSGGSVHVVSFFGAASGTGYTGTIGMLPTIKDVAGNVLYNEAGNASITGIRTQNLGDGQSPVFEYAKSIGYTNPDVVLIVKWSEPINLPSTTADLNKLFPNIRITEIPGRVLINGQAFQAPSWIQGSGPGMYILPVNKTLSSSANGAMTIEKVTDMAGHSSPRIPSAGIEDGVTPNLFGDVKLTGPNTISIRTDEPVIVTTDTFEIEIDHDGDGSGAIISPNPTPQQTRTISSIEGSYSDSITITFDGDPVSTDATGTLTVDRLVDFNGNLMGLEQYDYRVATILKDAQPPKVVSAKVVEQNKIVLVFSEAINSDVSRATFGSLRIDGESSDRNITNKSLIGKGTRISSETIGLTFSGSGVGDNDGARLVITNVNDFSNDGNALTNHTVRVEAGQIPTVESALLTAANRVTVQFSEPVEADTSVPSVSTLKDAFTNLKFPGEGTRTVDATITAATLNQSVATLTFTVPAKFTVDADDTAVISINGIQDQSNPVRKMAAVTGMEVGDGQAPAIKSASITGPNTATIQYSEPVTTARSDYSNLRISGETDPRKITGFSRGAVDTVTITFDGPSVPNNGSGIITIQNTITDLSEQKNRFAQAANTSLRDGQPPTLESIEITGPNRITAIFSEPVRQVRGDSGTADAFVAFVVHPDDGRDTAITSGSSPKDTLTISISGDPVPLDATGTITINDNIADSQMNRLAPLVDHPVVAGQIPRVLSALITGPNTAQVNFSEPVVLPRGASHFDDFGIAGEQEDRVIRSASAAGKSVTLTFGGKAVDSGATATVDISGVRDRETTPNTIAPVSGMLVGDGQPPTLKSARITAPNTATITFSEPVTTKRADFTSLSIGLDQNAPTREITNLARPTPESVALTFDGDTAAGDARGRIIISNEVTDASPQKNRLATAAGTHARSSVLGDGQPPALLRAEFIGGGIRVAYSESTYAPWNAYGSLNFGGTTRSIIQGTHSGTIHNLIYSGTTITDSAATMRVSAGVEDMSDNPAFDAAATVPVHRGEVPEFRSAMVTGHNELTVRFTEPVHAEADDFAVSITGISKKMTPKQASGSSTDTIVLVLDRDVFADGTTGTLDVTGTVTDLVGRDLGVTRGKVISPHQELVVQSSQVTGPNQITVTFVEQVTASASNFSNLVLTHGGQNYGRSISSVTGSGSDTILANFDGDAVPSGATATMDITGIVDSRGQTFVSLRGISIGDGQPPTLASVMMSSSNDDPSRAMPGDIVTLRLVASEPIRQPAITINEADTAPVRVMGNEWTATKTITADDASRSPPLIVFAADYTDIAGNVGIQVTGTTDDSAVTAFQCPEGQVPHPYQDDTCTVPLTGTVKVGLLLSDQQVNIAAASKAASDINAWLQENERQWTVSAPPMDTRQDPEVAMGQIRALKAEGVDVIVGMPTSAMVAAAKEYVAENDMVVISCCSTAPSLAMPDGIFRMVPDDSKQAPLMAKQITDAGKSEIAIIYRDDEWGRDLKDALDAEFGGTVLGSVPYAPARPNPADITSRASEALAGASSPAGTGVVFLGWNATASVMAESASDARLSGAGWFASTDSVGEQSIISNAAAFEFAKKTKFSAVALAPWNTQTTGAVAAHVRAETGSEPTAYTYSTYDAMWVAALAIDRAQSGAGTDVLPEVPAAAAGRIGALGPNALNANGDLALANYHAWTVVDDGWQDMGPISLSSVAGKVCATAKNNGTCDPGDPGLVTDPPYKMYLEPTVPNPNIRFDGQTYLTTEVGENGAYRFDNVIPGIQWNVQTLYYPPGHVTFEPTSWFKKGITLDAGQTETFDVAFYRSPPQDLVTLELRTYNDANRNGAMDAGEGGDPGLVFVMYTYVTGMYEDLVTDANGSVTKSDILPANWAILEGPQGWSMTSIDYQRTDDASDIEHHSSKELRVFDPAPGSTHTMTIGLWQAP